MAKRVSVIDSDGQFSRRRLGWVKRQTEGSWINGAYVFPPRAEQAHAEVVAAAPALGSPGQRAASLFGRQWAQPDTREFPIDAGYWDDRAVMRFWADQSSHGKAVVARR